MYTFEVYGLFGQQDWAASCSTYPSWDKAMDAAVEFARVCCNDGNADIGIRIVKV